MLETSAGRALGALGGVASDGSVYTTFSPRSPVRLAAVDRHSYRALQATSHRGSVP